MVEVKKEESLCGLSSFAFYDRLVIASSATFHQTFFLCSLHPMLVRTGTGPAPARYTKLTYCPVRTNIGKKLQINHVSFGKKLQNNR